MDKLTGPQRGEHRAHTPLALAVEWAPGEVGPLVIAGVIDLRKPPEWTGIRRRCHLCGMIKDEGAFPWKSRDHTRRMGRCRHCDAIRSRNRYAPDARSFPSRKGAIRTNEQRAEQAKRQRAYYARHRARAIEVYGGQCVWCGAVDDLEFDHPGNDGAAHRLVEQVNAMLVRISRTGRPLDDWRLQLLCVPCHRSPQWKARRATGTPTSSPSSAVSPT